MDARTSPVVPIFWEWAVPSEDFGSSTPRKERAPKTGRHEPPPAVFRTVGTFTLVRRVT